MTTSELMAILARHGLAIDDTHAGAGRFRDLYCGTAKPLASLSAAASEIRARGHSLVKVDRVDNPDHPDHGKAMLIVESFGGEGD